MENSPILVSALQFAPMRGNVDFNLLKINELAGGTEAKLLVLPELASTGYFFTEKEELLELAEEPESGAFCGWMRRYAEAHGTVVIGGFAERTNEGRMYNSALIALPDGSWKVYRKTHLFYKEHLIFEPGDSGFFNVEWEGIRYGTMICYDWRFPEASRTLALGGADIIAHPSNLVAAKALWGPAMSIRALENKVIAVTANRCGADELAGERLDFSGESQICDMNGRPLAVAGPDEECLLSAEVRPVATRTKSFNAFNDIFTDRRPEMYAC
jgi:predicted amidohydrolase